MRKRTLYLLTFTMLLGSIGYGLIFPFLPGVARSLGASDFVAVMIGSVFALADFIVTPLWGRASDRYGRRPVLLISIVMSTVGLMMLWGASSVTTLVVARLVGGLAAGADAVIMAYVTDVTSEGERAKGMGIVGAALGAGVFGGPVVGALLEANTPLAREGAFSALVGAALTGLNMLLLVGYLPESLPKEKRAKELSALPWLRESGVLQVLALPGIGLLAAINFVRMTSFAGLNQTFRLFLEDEIGLGLEHTGYVLGMVGTIMIAIQAAGIRLLVRLFRETTIAFLGIFVEAIGFLMLAAAPRLGVHAAAFLYCASAVIAVGGGAANPCLSSLASKIGHESTKGTVLGTVLAFQTLGAVVGPVIAGALYQELGHATPYVAGSLLAGTAMLCTARLRRLDTLAPAARQR